MKVVDISGFNGNVDFNKLKDGCDAVIMRAGYRGYGSGMLVRDVAFVRNIKGARAAGIPLSVYFVTQAINEQEAIQEANYVEDLIKGGVQIKNINDYIDLRLKQLFESEDK